VDELVAWTGLPRAFVKKVLRRFTAGGCWPRFSTYSTFDLPGPCLDTVRDIQVGLGFGIRHEEDNRVWYELSSRADDNIDELRRGWGSTKRIANATPRNSGTKAGESAPAVFVATGRWSDVRDNPDLAGRSRFLTARLAR
jgi:hypothetical protein